MPETREAHLFVLAGPDLARSFRLGERTTLGRSEECQVVLRDRSISRKHAVLVCSGGQWFVQDLGSTNGVSKDGRRAERIELADGDEFKLGDLPLRFKLQALVASQEIEFDPMGGATTSPLTGEGKRRIERQPDAAPEVEVEIEIEGPDEPQPASALAQATAFRPPRAARRTGFFAADLEQHPFWLRALVVLALMGLASGLAYAVFRLVQWLRAGA